MKSKIKIATLALLLATSYAFTQTTTEIERAGKTVESANRQIDSTVVAVNHTIENTKEAVNKVGGILFGKKDKNKTTNNNVVINITSVTYDNQSVTQLHQEISNTKLAKRIIKTYSNGQMTIKMDSKASADAIWQKVPKEIRTNFNISEISEKSIVLNLKN
tara:strand:+ start:574 stop:1056 length:483 start_codon:yes stop_codon:yes gene_type:complete